MNFLNPWAAVWTEWAKYWLDLFWPHWEQPSTSTDIVIPPAPDEETVS